MGKVLMNFTDTQIQRIDKLKTLMGVKHRVDVVRTLIDLLDVIDGQESQATTIVASSGNALSYFHKGDCVRTNDRDDLKEVSFDFFYSKSLPCVDVVGKITV